MNRNAPSAYGPAPWLQRQWDWRAATNFIAGGAGGGLVAFAAFFGAGVAPVLGGAVLVALGLLAVWFEIGRPWRAFNVMRNVRTSWMARESIVAAALLAAVAAFAIGAAVDGGSEAISTAGAAGRESVNAAGEAVNGFGETLAGAARAAAVALALAFVWCQAHLVQAAKGIPAWREPLTVPLLVATGLGEGGGLTLAAAAALATPLPLAAWAAFAAALAARLALRLAWRGRIARTAAPRALAAADRAGRITDATSLFALAAAAAVAVAPLPHAAVLALQALAGLAACGGGAWFKFSLVCQAAFNQGFAIPRLPVRGVRRAQEATWKR